MAELGHDSQHPKRTEHSEDTKRGPIVDESPEPQLKRGTNDNDAVVGVRDLIFAGEKLPSLAADSQADLHQEDDIKGGLQREEYAVLTEVCKCSQGSLLMCIDPTAQHQAGSYAQQHCVQDDETAHDDTKGTAVHEALNQGVVARRRCRFSLGGPMMDDSFKCQVSREPLPCEVSGEHPNLASRICVVRAHAFPSMLRCGAVNHLEHVVCLAHLRLWHEVLHRHQRLQSPSACSDTALVHDGLGPFEDFHSFQQVHTVAVQVELSA
mmetsp:Transcript_23979/g.62971  ORF Transcript_23979/g.62971 Transcript_23979/m.62971 type:complete len:266 (+) Transcript_23979:347-1144(+)